MKTYPLTPAMVDEIFEGTKDDKRVVGFQQSENFRDALVSTKNFIPFVGELFGAVKDAIDIGLNSPRDEKGKLKELSQETVAKFVAPFLTALHMGVLIGMNAASHAEEATLARTGN